MHSCQIRPKPFLEFLLKLRIHAETTPTPLRRYNGCCGLAFYGQSLRQLQRPLRRARRLAFKKRDNILWWYICFNRGFRALAQVGQARPILPTC